MKKQSVSAIIYYFKFFIWSCFGCWDYFKSDKLAIIWFILAVLCLVFGAIEDIKHHIDKTLKQ